MAITVQEIEERLVHELTEATSHVQEVALLVCVLETCRTPADFPGIKTRANARMLAIIEAICTTLDTQTPLDVDALLRPYVSMPSPPERHDLHQGQHTE
jgi:hypothetical protein